ncbi:hypothetical protein [Streptomyces sp. NPDC058872]|uniref:hypothetical protein n=1 Tax=Streptomyces sp. NPDC058872 TaxID=3346661 RepID=UPI0036A66D7D
MTQPAEHCGHQPDPVIGQPTECVLRPGHKGSHADHTGMRWWMRQPSANPTVQGRCPACHATSLFLGTGGHVTCARIDCPNPCAADDLLHQPAAQPAEQCCVCGSPDVTYHNYREQPFCWPCANCQCGLNPCVRETLYKPTQQAERHTVDTITSDALDALYEQLEAAQQTELARQLATCDKAFASATLRAAQSGARAKRAEAELTALKAIATGYCGHCGRGDCSPTAQQWLDQRDRANKAEATIERVRTWGAQTQHGAAAAEVLAALDEEQPGHRYLSTSCLHDHHDYCNNNRGIAGPKRSAQCKWCPAPCICHCHNGGEQPAGSDSSD